MRVISREDSVVEEEGEGEIENVSRSSNEMIQIKNTVCCVVEKEVSMSVLREKVRGSNVLDERSQHPSESDRPSPHCIPLDHPHYTSRHILNVRACRYYILDRIPG